MDARAGDPLATVVPAPQGGQDEFLERLIEGLGRLREPVHLIVDDHAFPRANRAGRRTRSWVYDRPKPRWRLP